MKVLAIIFATTLSTLVAGLAVHKCGCLAEPHEAVSHRCIQLGARPRVNGASYREAAARWRHNQPHHWRYCLLNR
jgi:hypothetical protein